MSGRGRAIAALVAAVCAFALPASAGAETETISGADGGSGIVDATWSCAAAPVEAPDAEAADVPVGPGCEQAENEISADSRNGAEAGEQPDLTWSGTFNSPSNGVATGIEERPAKGRAAGGIGLRDVEIRNFEYSPPKIEVDRGQAVSWTNFDTEEHSATADDGAFDTGLLGKGETGTVTVDKPGTYPYFCTLHPGMKAKLVVASGKDEKADESNDRAGGDGGVDSSGTSDTTFDPATTFDDSTGQLPMTGLETVWLLVASAVLIALGLLLAALELHLRPLPRGPR